MVSSLIYLRPITIADAETSYKWRNDEQIWKHTDFVVVQYFTAEMEKKWLAGVINRPNERRFAICVLQTNQYVGNVQLLNINDNAAEFDIFIGERNYWAKGIGFEATCQLLKIAFAKLNLDIVFVNVRPANIVAIRCYRRAGFETISTAKGIVKMVAVASTIKKCRC